MIRTLAVAAATAAILTPAAAHAAPHPGCVQTFEKFTLNVCTGQFTFPAHKGPEWVIVTGPSMSGSRIGPTWLPNAGGTIHLPIDWCTGQVDVRSTKAPGHHIAGRQWVNTTGQCAPTPTPTTPTPTGGTPSTPPTSTTTTTTHSPSPSHSSHSPSSSKTTGRLTSSPHSPARSNVPEETAPQPELARTGIDRGQLLGLAALAGGFVLAGFGLLRRPRKARH